MKNLIKSAKGAFLTAGAFIGSSAMAAQVSDVATKADAIGSAFFTENNTTWIGNVLVGVGLLMLFWGVFQYVRDDSKWKATVGGGAFIALLGAAFKPVIQALGVTLGA